MSKKIQRQRKSKEIAERREKEAFEAAARYRNKIPRGDWTPLECEIAIEFNESQRDLSRKMRPYKTTTKSCGKRSAGYGDQMAAARKSTPTVPGSATMTNRLQESLMQRASNKIAEAASAERSDVFTRRMLGQIDLRFEGGRQRPKAERVQLGQKLCESLRLVPGDLMDRNGSQAVDDK
jgi:hypothetical protein